MKTFRLLLFRIAACMFVAFCVVPRITAQFVFVPDTSLRSALNEWVPGAVDASGYLDAGNPAVLAENTLTLNVDWTTVDLTGVDALTNLTSLTVLGRLYNVMQDNLVPSDSGTFSIPNWPGGLLSLKLDRGTWNVLPPFPVGLETLYIDAPGQAVMPMVPSGVTTLTVVDQTTLSAFPDIPTAVTYLSLTSRGNPFPTLPEGIGRLSLSGTPGVALPTFPNSVDSLYLERFDATSIAAWPSSAHTIIALQMTQVEQVAPFPVNLSNLRLQIFDSLQSIPAFPANLNRLSLLVLTTLDSLPSLPPSLHHFMLDVMPALRSLPVWPNGIEYIGLANLHVSEIPPFPSSLTFLYVNALDSVTCLPLLPQGLSELSIDAEILLGGTTPITCLPNFPPAVTLHWGELASTPQDPDMLCTSLNSSCDFLNPAATGTTYWDQNANGTRDASEPGYPYVTLHQQPGSAMHGVGGDGTYAWPMPIGDYTLSASPDNPYVQSIAPAQLALSFTVAGEVSTGNDFGVVLQPNVQDLRIDLTGPSGVPGFDTYGTITCENVGTMVVDATVTFQLDAVQSWVGATPTPSSVVGNTVTWDMLALQVGEARQIDLVAHTDSTIALGTPLVQTVEVAPVASDATPSDNMSTVNTEVIGSFDPNDKQVQPAALSSADVAAGNNELTYTIRFQNTGTWPAVKVRVVDTLSADLQWTTFRKISSSHDCTWELNGAGVLTFQFDPIDLSDSTNNEPRSHGFVKFAIKPATTLQLGMTVSNSADIFFDFNVPVRTPPAVFTVDDGTTVAETLPSAIQLYPNPVRDVLWVKLNTADQTSIQVFDAMGREHIRQNAASGEVLSVDVNGLAPGSYSLRCISDRGTWSATFLKQ